MGFPGYKKVLIGVCIGFLLLCLGIAGVFFSRPPVVLVSDAAFDGLYGRWRTWEKRIEISLRLFRPVAAARIAENTGSDVVVFAVEEAAAAPYVVLFPYRYYEGARRYAGQYPDVPVVLLGNGIGTSPPDEASLFIRTDRRTDFYRAGRCAAVFALDGGGRVLFFQDDLVSVEDREAFLLGLQEQGYDQRPVYLGINSDYASLGDISCVVMTGSASAFLEREENIPIILFSWVDPAITSTKVKLIFDDSPWALAVGAVEMAFRVGEQDQGLIPSNIMVLERRISSEGVLQDIKKVVYSNIL
jgi:hypothetical protein